MSERTDKVIRELGFDVRKEEEKMAFLERLGRQKPKNPQRENHEGVDGRDLFQTPSYATDLLIPFIPKDIVWVWEPACGEGKIVNRLLEKTNLEVFASDVRLTEKMDNEGYNFVDGNEENTIPNVVWELWQHSKGCIITNPPFSLKKKFYFKCREFNVPFALLIPADYSGWIIQATIDGAEKIIPTRRIDYITPTGLSGATGHTSYFHSMWLTWGFGLGKSETFVELTTKDKKENI